MLYGCETWPLTSKEDLIFVGNVRKVTKRLSGVTGRDSSAELCRRLLNVNYMETEMRKRRLR